MTTGRPFSVVVRTATPPRLEHLERLLQDAGYRTARAVPRTGDPFDAWVVDLVGARATAVGLDPVDETYGGLEATVLVVPERLATQAWAVPQAVVHVDVPGGVQALLLRVAVGCRRGRAAYERLERAGVHVDPLRHTVSCATGTAALSPLEFRLLGAVLRGGGEPVLRSELVGVTWRDRARVPAATLDSHVRGLRKKLMSAGVPIGIRTVRGVGYAVC